MGLTFQVMNLISTFSELFGGACIHCSSYHVQGQFFSSVLVDNVKHCPLQLKRREVTNQGDVVIKNCVMVHCTY